MTLFVTRCLDMCRLREDGYIERAIFEMFVALHRSHNIQPDTKNQYRIIKHLDKWDVNVRLEVTSPHEYAMHDPGALLIDRERVQTYIDQVQWDTEWGLTHA